MAAKTVPDDEVVYVAFKSLMHGEDTQIRKLPFIKRLVRKHKQQKEVAQLLKEYGESVICDQLRRLLQGQVFESTLEAKCESPELFDVSQARSAERAKSEAEAASSHAKEVEEALASSHSDILPYESASDSGRTAAEPQAKASPTKKEKTPLGIIVPSLFPLEFEFITGYKILVRTQQVLEFACFRFAEKDMPEILEKRRWHCPESAELNLWATEFSKRLGKLEKKLHRPSLPFRPLRELFLSIRQIRHHAVHRVAVTAKELEQFMADGEILVRLFEDSTAIPVMARARSEVQKAAAEMEQRKNVLEARLTKVLQDVADKRAELDRIEAKAIADTKAEDKEYQLFAGTQLQETIWLDGGAVGDGLVATQSTAADRPVNDSLLEQLSTTLESDIASYRESKVEDAVSEGPMPSALGKTFIGDPDSHVVPDEVEEARSESLGPVDADADADADFDGEGVETEKHEVSCNASEGSSEPEAC